MTRAILCSMVLVALSAGCRDAAREPAPGSPVAPADPNPSASAAPASSSTVCAAYHARLGEARSALARAPGDDSLREDVATFEAVISDACD